MMKARFAYDPDEALAHLRRNDPLFAELIERVGPFGLELRPVKSLFEAMLRSIVYQQLHVARRRRFMDG
jgi:DNA-3-methyladenine glycosylase II